MRDVLREGRGLDGCPAHEGGEGRVAEEILLLERQLERKARVKAEAKARGESVGPKATRESSIQNGCLEDARRYRKLGLAIKLRKIHNAGFGATGTVDCLGSVCGLMTAIEFKRPGGKATDLQLEDLRTWKEAGAATAVIDDRREFRALIEQIAHDRGWRKNETGLWHRVLQPSR